MLTRMIQASVCAWIAAVVAGLIALNGSVARAAELRTVDGEGIDCEWVGASDQAVTVSPKDGGESREIALADLDRLTLVRVITTRTTAEPEGPFIDNDGPHSMRMTKEGRIKLRAGLHRIVIAFIQGPEAAGLDVQVTLPGKWSQALGGPMLYHVPEGAAEPVSPGLDEQGFRLPENPEHVEPQIHYEYFTYDAPDHPDYLTNVKYLPGLEKKSSGLTHQVGIGVADREERYGILFTGYLKVEEDGEYGFRLTSDDGCQIYFGQTPDLLSNDAVVRTVAIGDWRVDLADGGRVVGSLESWDDAGPTVRMAFKDESVSVGLPVSVITSITRSASDGDDAVDMTGAPDDADTVFVASEDGPAKRVSGVVLGIDGGALRFRYGDQERRINLDKIVAIKLVGAAGVVPTLDFHQVIGLANGQSVAGKLIGASEGRVLFDTAWDQRIDVPMNGVTYLRTRNGRLVYLSDVTPTGVEQTPYFDRVIPYRTDTSLSGEAIKLYGDGTIYERGVSTHARTVLRYALGGRFAGFKSTVGLLDPLGARGDVGLRVLGDGRVLFERASLTAGAAPIELDLDITGVDELTIETDFGSGQDVGDRVGWAGARLIRSADGP